MQRLLIASAALALSVGPVMAQKRMDPGNTRAMEQQSPNNVARDPGEVQQQQGRSSSASPGTVGAAPGTNAPSSDPAGRR